MKVIATDNFDRGYVPDHVVHEGLTEQEARSLADELNDRYKGDDLHPWFYRAVPDDYTLFEFEP